jgi:hypothetical protein
MKNKMGDVRNHLVAMLELLGDDKCTPEVIERAKATSLVAGTYIAAVKTEIDALRLADEINRLPSSVDLPTVIEHHEAAAPALKALAGGRA